ncbi:hypothetical protein FCI23_10785 [Actinacidiphila oryziradicis]|uniref:Uncharacterized protein n=1 Tax=Actinacidiphila oryziradicis TaxID=2571141 RepID=A0A4U0SPK4_9ACTN|nr:hypothetical protein FCI23_10785 [Actinacidiphila oryziradicis]
MLADRQRRSERPGRQRAGKGPEHGLSRSATAGRGLQLPTVRQRRSRPCPAWVGWVRPIGGHLCGRRLSYSVGMTITDVIHAAVFQIPESAWTPAVASGARQRFAGRAGLRNGDRVAADLSSGEQGQRLGARCRWLALGGLVSRVEWTRLRSQLLAFVLAFDAPPQEEFHRTDAHRGDVV